MTMRKEPQEQPRRVFLKTLGAVGAGVVFAGNAAPDVQPAESNRKIKLGVVGCGGRGSWIAGLFKQHGGYEMRAVADYFQEAADKCGDALGVDKARRFSTLSGYKRLLESGVEAVALEVPPYFFPEQATAAVEAGKHVYMAKPVAPDVPGALKILAAGKKARQKNQCFMVDYQMPTDPVNIEIVKRIRAEGFGKISQVATVGVGGGFADPPFTENYESRLRGLVWVNDTAIGCDYIGNFDIHAIDAALWVIGQRPIAAAGNSRICRSNPHGDARDVCSVVFEYADGLVHNHFGQALQNFVPGELSCRVHGQTGNALINYWGAANLRSVDDRHSGPVENLYEAGAKRNIATFCKEVTEGRFENPTIERSVDGVLTCVLGREAAIRRIRLTMVEMIKENKKLEINLKGLKA
jgi:myo-inositol 2-dehydrogenase / D-chiro-inositol 1-dehydrogenase